MTWTKSGLYLILWRSSGPWKPICKRLGLEARLVHPLAKNKVALFYIAEYFFYSAHVYTMYFAHESVIFTGLVQRKYHQMFVIIWMMHGLYIFLCPTVYHFLLCGLMFLCDNVLSLEEGVLCFCVGSHTSRQCLADLLELNVPSNRRLLPIDSFVVTKKVYVRSFLKLKAPTNRLA